MVPTIGIFVITLSSVNQFNNFSRCPSANVEEFLFPTIQCWISQSATRTGSQKPRDSDHVDSYIALVLEKAPEETWLYLRFGDIPIGPRVALALMADAAQWDEPVSCSLPCFPRGNRCRDTPRSQAIAIH